MEDDQVSSLAKQIVERLGAGRGWDFDPRRRAPRDAQSGEDGAEVVDFMEVVAVGDGEVVAAAAVLAGGAEAGREASAAGKRVEGGKTLPGGKIQQGVKPLGAEPADGLGRLRKRNDDAAVGAGKDFSRGKVRAHTEERD